MRAGRVFHHGRGLGHVILIELGLHLGLAQPLDGAGIARGDGDALQRANAVHVGGIAHGHRGRALHRRAGRIVEVRDHRRHLAWSAAGLHLGIGDARGLGIDGLLASLAHQPRHVGRREPAGVVDHRLARRFQRRKVGHGGVNVALARRLAPALLFQVVGRLLIALLARVGTLHVFHFQVRAQAARHQAGEKTGVVAFSHGWPLLSTV